ncbi:MAG TPA: hypothetical protein VHU15_17840 [Stellaceae bacterium]|jgi:hypothetical protein|nr:hypothetical protein [Stellaceae bacterium]
MAELMRTRSRPRRSRAEAAERVYTTFMQWKRKQIPDKTAFYHTALDIAYRRGGVPERFALLLLRYQRSAVRGKMILFRAHMLQVLRLSARFRP